MMKMKYITIIAFLCVLIWSCYSEDDYDPEVVLSNISIDIENDNALADGLQRIEVVVNVAGDLESIDSDSAFFLISRKNVEEYRTSALNTFINNGEKQKTGKIFLTSLIVEEITVEGGVVYDGVTLFKSSSINFQLAPPESISVGVDNSIVMADSTFSQIALNTSVSRNEGQVSSGSIVSVEVIDTLGVGRGILSQEEGVVGMDGTFSTFFSMGLDNYTGPLHVIANALNESRDVVVTDTLLVLSK